MSTTTITTTSADDLIIPDMHPAEAAARIKTMRRQEEAQAYQCHDAEPIHLPLRSIMCEWCFQMADACDYRRETVEVAMSYLDQFLGKNPAILSTTTNTRRTFQLIAVACLYLAIKLYETVKMSPQVLAELSQGKYTTQDLEKMERTILTTLDWRVHGPTRLEFVQYFLVLLPLPLRENETVVQAIAEMARFQTEVATADNYFGHQRQSATAVACILNALNSTTTWKRHEKEFLESVQRHVGAHVDGRKELQTRLLERMDGGLSELLPMLVNVDEEDNDNEGEGDNEMGMDPTTIRRSSVKMTTAVEGKNQWDDVGEYSPVCVSQKSIQQQ